MGTTGIPAFDAYYDEGLTALVIGGTVVPAWSPDGSTLAYVDGPVDDRRAWRVDVSTGERSGLVDVASARTAIRACTGETPPGRGLPFAALRFVSDHVIAFLVGDAALTLHLDTGEVEPDAVDPHAAPQQFFRALPYVDPWPALEIPSPDGLHMLAMRDGDIVVRSTADGREVQLTTDGTDEIQWRVDYSDPTIGWSGVDEPATTWSPDGSRIAATRADLRGVGRMPKIHYLKRSDEVVYRYGAKAGGVLERMTLHVLDTYGRPPVEIDLGDTTDSYPVHAAWFPSGRELLVFKMSRDCLRIDVFVADARTGETRLVLTEEGKTFLRILHDVYFGRKLGVWIVPGEEHLLWLSDRSGVKQLYLYDMSGNLVRQLTDGEGPVDYAKRIEGGHVYYTAHSDASRPYDLQLHRVPLAGGPSERLTEHEGQHTALFSPRGDVFVDTWSRPDQPPTSVLRRADGKLLAALSTADRSRLEALGWVPPREFATVAADGKTELWGTMFFPNDFDPEQTYPVLEHIYGGAQWTVAAHSYEADWYTTHSQALAQLGFVVIMVDARGTPERTKAFHDFVVDNWGACVEDHAETIRQLCERQPFLDGDRVGVYGHSWGGYHAFRCLVDRPDVYKAAASSAPGFDVYSLLLYECYLGLPQENPDVYRAAEVFRRAGEVRGEYMILNGTADHYTFTDAIKMSEALIQAGKSHEFVVLPEQTHEYDKVHDGYFWRKVGDFFHRALHVDPAFRTAERVRALVG
ncbi:MAG TPA: alpha/beta fold hydrolase [Gaiellaceae bacterium]